jgi:hypothetical protein
MRHGIVIVDHGSRRPQSNQMLEEVARLFAERFTQRYEIVEPAHMELCEPSIATAYDRCVARGATHVVVCPFFLGPGKHWTSDIPRLAAEAAAKHPGTRYHVTMPLGIDDLILDLIEKRVRWCADHGLLCDKCQGSIRSGEPETAAQALAPAAPPAHDAMAATGSGAAQVCSSCPYQAAINAGATLTPAAG